MNDPAVVAAFHVGAKNGAWAECGGINYSRNVGDERNVIYPALLAAKLHIVIYNGEADACVPITDNQWWTDSLNLPTITPWTSWAASDGSAGGYITTYQAPGSFAFITIRGAGHMVCVAAARKSAPRPARARLSPKKTRPAPPHPHPPPGTPYPYLQPPDAASVRAGLCKGGHPGQGRVFDPPQRLVEEPLITLSIGF